MISKKAIDYLETQFGVNEFAMDFDLVFQDLTDDDLKAGLRYKPESYWNLIYILSELQTDEEVISHILGYASLSERKKLEAEIHELQERNKSEFK